MHQDEQPVSLELDTSTASKLNDLARTWGVSKLEAVRRALAQTTARTIKLDAPSEELDVAMSLESEQQIKVLTEVVRDLNKREVFLLACHLQGIAGAEIATEMEEDLAQVRLELNRVLVKVRYRLRQARSSSKPKETVADSRLEAFAKLQRRIELTSAKATAWQDAVRDARR